MKEKRAENFLSVDVEHLLQDGHTTDRDRGIRLAMSFDVLLLNSIFIYHFL